MSFRNLRNLREGQGQYSPGRIWRERLLAVFGCFFLSLFPILWETSVSLAADWKLVPSLSLKEEYNDNIFFDETVVKKDFITTITPGLQLSRNSERMQLGLTGKFDRRIYHNNSDLNATNQLYQGSARYSLTPEVSLSGRAEYGKDSSPDRDIETTGLVLNNQERRWQRYSLAGDYNISEKTAASLSYDYYKENYDSPEESDLESNGVNLLLIHDLSSWVEAMKGRLNIGYTHYVLTDLKIDNYDATVGLSKAFSEVWSILVDVGARYTESHFKVQEMEFILTPPFYQTVKEEKRSDGWGFVGSAVLSRRGEKSTLDLNLSHDLMPASGRNGTTNRTTLGFRATQRFTYELSGNVSGGYYRNKSDKQEYSLTEIDEETLYVSSGVKYEFTKDYALDASYTYTKTDYKVTNTDADRNLFMVRFNIQVPFLD